MSHNPHVHYWAHLWHDRLRRCPVAMGLPRLPLHVVPHWRGTMGSLHTDNLGRGVYLVVARNLHRWEPQVAATVAHELAHLATVDAPEDHGAAWRAAFFGITAWAAGPQWSPDRLEHSRRRAIRGRLFREFGRTCGALEDAITDTAWWYAVQDWHCNHEYMTGGLDAKAA